MFLSAAPAPYPDLLSYEQQQQQQTAFARNDLVPPDVAAPATGFDSWIPMTSAALDWVSKSCLIVLRPDAPVPANSPL